MATDQIAFKCSKCGGTLFEKPANPKPTDLITCAGCGATSRYGDVQAAAVKLTKQEVQRAFTKAFKGMKGIPFKK